MYIIRHIIIRKLQEGRTKPRSEKYINMNKNRNYI